MSDLISRQAAICALSTITMYKGSIPYNTAVMRIEQLPPANCSEFPNSSDTISRQMAIDALARTAREKFNLSDEFNHYLAGLMDGETAIRRLPSVQPERKTGKWIPQNLNKSDGMISTAVYYYPKCSVCGANANYTNFCPNCGADMRGEQDG